LLRGWNKTLEIVNGAIEHNKKSGVLQPDRFVSFLDTKPMNIKKKENWIAQCTNIKTGQLYTLDNLIAANVISDNERHLFGELPLPRRELISIYRVQLADKSEWLQRFEQWFGLSKSASVVTISVEDLDYYRDIMMEQNFIDKDPSNPGGAQAHVQMIGEFYQYFINPKVYTTPFSKTTVEQALVNALPPLTQKSFFGKISLGLKREGVLNERGLTDIDNSLDAFINRDFDELFDRSSQPAGNNVTNINIDPKDLEAFLKYKKAKEEHGEDQYQ
jgi:hypothetical protein